MSSPLVSLWLDHPAIGCGWRRFVVVAVGRKWVRLLCPASLQRVTLAKAEFERIARRDESVKLKQVARRLRANRNDHRRLGLPDGGVVVKQALAVLRTARRSSRVQKA